REPEDRLRIHANDVRERLTKQPRHPGTGGDDEVPRTECRRVSDDRYAGGVCDQARHGFAGSNVRAERPPAIELDRHAAFGPKEPGAGLVVARLVAEESK